MSYSISIPVSTIGEVLSLNHIKSTCSFALQFSGKSVGIVGLGRIGSAIAKKAEAFGCAISYIPVRRNWILNTNIIAKFLLLHVHVH